MLLANTSAKRLGCPPISCRFIMPWVPLFPNPLSDIGWILSPGFLLFPPDSFCAKLQLKYLDCVEAYGYSKGKEKCSELFFDLHECNTNKFQNNRVMAIRKERMKQYRMGKISKPFEEHPILDSYLFTE